MAGNSKPVTSNQQDIHPDLERVVRKHLTHPYRRPCKRVSVEVFERLCLKAARHDGPIIFDSGCGAGDSTIALAQRYPEALVVGMDKSKVRIRKAERKYRAAVAANVILLRADVIDIWRLANQAGWRLQHHFLLYPNPWPKKRHLKKRWHAHPVFPHLRNIGGNLVLRSNWEIYVREFAAATKNATGQAGSIRTITVEDTISAFERKYWLSGQALFEFSWP